MCHTNIALQQPIIMSRKGENEFHLLKELEGLKILVQELLY